jgi:MFS family permease
VNPSSRKIQRIYLFLLLLHTLAASLIWGINTLFLLDAGLSNLEAFAANAFFTAGMVVFEVPTGVVADTWGRRTSYLLGTVTLAATTLMYWWLWVAEGAFWLWAIVSVLLGLGFTFFSGAVEAWLVDALHHTGYDGALETVMGRGQMVGGVAMLVGSVGGGVVAQATNLGVPFLMRCGVLLAMFLVASLLMRDLGFEPEPAATPLRATRRVLGASIEHGLGNPPVRWVMLAAPFTMGVGFYAFYALQPFLLELWGDPEAYTIAGVAAAAVAGAQILGGWLAPRIRGLFRRRTTVLLLSVLVSSALLAAIGWAGTFWVALALVIAWSILNSAAMPVRQAYINDMIPSKQRATVLSFDSLMGSSGGIFVQPVLGRAADAQGYGASLAIGAAIQLAALPCLVASRRRAGRADEAMQAPDAPAAATATNTD